MHKEIDITIYGRVQGVGFRPFVAEQAEALGIAGTVRNAGGIVKIHAGGVREALDEFVHRLSACPPMGARVKKVEVMELSQKDRKEGIKKNFLTAAELSGAGASEESTAESGKPATGIPATDTSFHIIESEGQKDTLRFLPPDMATCTSCVKELFDKKNRRYRYPFISCTVCGPRFSILENIPYDRDTITMRDFTMCPACRGEYVKRGDIRRHAQTIACPDCGPEVTLYQRKEEKMFSVTDKDNRISWEKKEDYFYASGETSIEKKEDFFYASGETSIEKKEDYFYVSGETAIENSIKLLREGKIVAMKDIGGYHFAFDPANGEAAKRLREFKGREKKPFAVMFSDMELVKEYCEVSDTEEKLLLSDARPIVLLQKKEGKDFAPEVCGESLRIGVLLPCNPLQYLLLKETGVLVMTSGNRGGEPILIQDEDMLALMRGAGGQGEALDRWKSMDREERQVPDAVLSHDRRILYGLDDSIYQVTVCGGREVIQLIRRARGLVPEPVPLPVKLPCDAFAAGGDLKAVFALGRENMVYLSAHFGDLSDVRAVKSRREAVSHMEKLLGIAPEKLVCDRHPAYISSQNMIEDSSSGREEMRQDDGIFKVLHHHAHVAAVIAEYDLKPPVIGIAFDGTGYGEDGTIWGGEFFLCGQKNYWRAGHLESIRMAGGDASARNAAVSAYAYLYAAAEKGYLTWEELSALSCPILKESESRILKGALEKNIHIIRSSSMGRLFDAAAAVLGICMGNSYEGECPERLQAYAEKYEKNSLKHAHKGNSSFEQAHDTPEKETFPIFWEKEGWVVDSVYFIAALAKRKAAGEDAGQLAYGFHEAVAGMTVEICDRIRDRNQDAGTVALGGGTMYNGLLLRLLIPALEQRGFAAYIGEKVPSGDGGLAYGQMALLGGNDYVCSFTGDGTGD